MDDTESKPIKDANDLEIIQMGKSPIDNDLLATAEYIEWLKNCLSLIFGVPKELFDNPDKAGDHD